MEEIKDTFVYEEAKGLKPTVAKFMERFPNCDRKELEDFAFGFSLLANCPSICVGPGMMTPEEWANRSYTSTIDWISEDEDYADTGWGSEETGSE